MSSFSEPLYNHFQKPPYKRHECRRNPKGDSISADPLLHLTFRNKKVTAVRVVLFIPTKIMPC